MASFFEGSTPVDQTSLALAVVGLLLTVATFWRVSTVRKAQAEERELMRRLYGTDTLADRLRSAASFLKIDADGDAQLLADELVRLVGQIEGMSRVLEAVQTGRNKEDGSFRVHNHDYYTLDSVRADVGRARSAVDILIFRNMFASSPGILQAFERAAQRGVRIRVLCLSSTAGSDVLSGALHILPRPLPDSVDEFKRQLGDAEKQISRVVGRDWGVESRRRFEYRGYSVPPVWHLVRVDGIVKLGFVGTLTDAQPARYDERPYVLIPVSSVPGEILTKNFEHLWHRSTPLRLEDDHAASRSPRRDDE